jgi:lysine 2,3-aminomutase
VIEVSSSDDSSGVSESSSEVPKSRTTEPRWGRARYFPGVSDAEWNDWKWQFRHRVTTIEELVRHVPVPPEQEAVLRKVLKDFRMGITPYYLSLIDADDPHDPILRQVVPLEEEYTYRAVGEEDPLGEEQYSPVPGITHRYPDRVLMVVSNLCAIYCRYCTRKRTMYESAVPDIEIDRMVDYIARTPSVRDVVVSGGDPLTFSVPVLERVLAKLRAIPHLEIIRIGSRVPVAIPQKIDDEMCQMLQKYHPLWINVHYNHPRELTPEAAQACDRLTRAGIPLNNQSVLLKGVNDDVPTMKALIHGLMRMRVRPYYLYQCDPVRGAEHFRTTIAKGVEIMEGLRGHTSGLAIPTYVVDAPGGGGKIPVGPKYLLAYEPEEGRAILRNFQGKVFEYIEPGHVGAEGGYLGGPLPGAPSEYETYPGLTGIPLAASNGSGNGKGPRKASTNGHGAATGNGNGANGHAANGNGAALPDGRPVIGKSRWVSHGAPARARVIPGRKQP